MEASDQAPAAACRKGKEGENGCELEVLGEVCCLREGRPAGFSELRADTCKVPLCSSVWNSNESCVPQLGAVL